MRRQTGSESAISSSRSTGALRGGGLIRQCFLIVQCKSVSFETQDAVWAEAEEQLDEYLASTHQYTQPVNRTPVYGAVAVAGRLLSINTTTTAAINLTGILRAHTGMIYKLHIISHI